MENLEKYRQIITQILRKYNHFLDTYSHFESKLIVSNDKNSYIVILCNLPNNNEYFHDFIIHLEIADSRIHILYDCIEIGNKLSNAGIPKRTLLWHGHPKPLNIDFAISLEKIYQRHKFIFATKTNPKQPEIKVNATSEELAQLSKIESKYIGRAIASHPNISLDLLLKLFSRYPAAVFANPNFNKFMDNNPNFLRSLYNAFPGIFSQVNDLVLPNFFIEWALAQKDLRAYICSSHKIPIKYLAKLIDDKECSIFANMMCRLERQGNCSNLSGNYPLSQDLAQKIEERYLYFQSICPKKDEDGFCNGVCMEIISCM